MTRPPNITSLITYLLEPATPRETKLLVTQAQQHAFGCHCSMIYAAEKTGSF